MGNRKAGGWTAVTLSERRIDVVEAQRGGSRPAVVRYESYPLELGALETLKRLKAGKQLAGPCSTLLQAGQYQLLQVDEPQVPEAELKQALRWQIREMVDFPVESAGLDLLRIPAYGAAARQAQLFVVAAPRAALEPCVQLFQEARLELTVIDIPELAQRNVAACYEAPGRALALLAFDASGGRLTFTADGELYAVRRLEISAADLRGSNGAGLFERVLLDVQRSLDNFDRNFSHLPLSRLLVLPPSGGEGIVEHLRENMFQPVELFDPADGFDLDHAPNLKSLSAFGEAMPALGAALRAESVQ